MHRLLQTWLLFSLLPLTGATSSSAHVTAIRGHVLNDDYDKFVYPSSPQRAVGTDVSLQVRIVQVVNVDPASGLMAIKVWLRMMWIDDRLAWDPGAFGNVTEIITAAVSDDSEAESNEIWVPDITLYNAHGGTNGMFEPALPNVYSDGTVFLSRPGTLEVLCKYSGLVAFPFDTLKCQFDIGGWSLDARFQGIVPFVDSNGDGCGAGFVELAYETPIRCRPSRSGGVSETVGDSYNEFRVIAVETLSQSLLYPSSQHPYPLIAYKASLERSSNFYILVVIVPDIVLTLLTFSLFIPTIDSPLGTNRMSIGMTIILVMQVEGVAISAWLPICAELLWVQIFVLVNLLCAYFALVETMAVQMLANKNEPTLLPLWFSLFMRSRLHSVTRRIKAKKLGIGSEMDKAEIRKVFDRLDVNSSGTISTKEIAEVCKSLNMQQTNEQLANFMKEIDLNKDGKISAEEFEAAFLHPSLASMLRLQGDRSSEKRKLAIMGNTGAFGITSYAGCVLRQKMSRVGAPARDVSREVQRRAPSPSGETQPGETTKETVDRWSDALTLAENLFFQMDTSAAGFIPNNVAADMLEFLIPDASPESVSSLLHLPASKDGELQMDDDGGVVRWEFVQLCNRLLETSAEGATERLQMAAENFRFAKAQEAKFYNVHWAKIGATIDYYSMIFGLLFYSTFLIGLFNMDLTDAYAGDPTATSGQHELAIAPLSAASVFWVLVPSIIASAITILYLLVTKSSQAKAHAKTAASMMSQSSLKSSHTAMKQESKQAQLAKSQSVSGGALDQFIRDREDAALSAAPTTNAPAPAPASPRERGDETGVGAANATPSGVRARVRLDPLASPGRVHPEPADQPASQD